MNENVAIWQRALHKLDIYHGEIDGVFGSGTRRGSFEAINRPDETPAKVKDGQALLVMGNQKATRNRPIMDSLRDDLIAAVTAVYGDDSRIVVYSGGQALKGSGGPRTGSVRHDDTGKGGRAADCYIYVKGSKISGIELAKLGQYWLAKKYGGVGLEMATGGIHLDNWVTPPPGGGMFWTYGYSDGKPWGSAVRAMLVKGAQGRLP